MLAAFFVISLALSLMTYHEVKALAHAYSHNAFMFIFHTIDFKVPPMQARFGTLDLYASWEPRLLSNLLGGWSTIACFNPFTGKVDANEFAWRVGVYAACWMLAICLLYMAALRAAALLPILGTYAGVAFGYMPNLTDRVCPWDMPALFFYTVFICLLIRRRLIWLLPLLPVAVLFKETAALLPVAFLFGWGSRRRRIGLFALGLALAGGAKLGANVWTHTAGYNPINLKLAATNLSFFMMGNFPHEDWYRIDWAFFNHPIFINAGFLVAFFIAARGRDPHVPMLRVLALLFIVLTLLCGVIFEYRIWFELIPIGLYPFYGPALLASSCQKKS